MTAILTVGYRMAVRRSVLKIPCFGYRCCTGDDQPSGRWKEATPGASLDEMLSSRFRTPRPGPLPILTLWLLLALAVIPGCASRKSLPEPERQPRRQPAGVEHVVEKGQTLWRIAQAYDIPMERLIGVNRIDDPDSIEVGLRLWVPGASERRHVPAAPPDERVARFLWPVPGGRVISSFGVRRSTHRHKGLDIAAAAGEPVVAAQDGTVTYAGSSLRGYGKTLIVDHGEGWSTLYAHNSALIARKGQRVQRGQRIARIGRSGNATTEHCHFEIRRGEVPINPTPLLSKTIRSRD